MTHGQSCSLSLYQQRSSDRCDSGMSRDAARTSRFLPSIGRFFFFLKLNYPYVRYSLIHVENVERFRSLCQSNILNTTFPRRQRRARDSRDATHLRKVVLGKLLLLHRRRALQCLRVGLLPRQLLEFLCCRGGRGVERTEVSKVWTGKHRAALTRTTAPPAGRRGEQLSSQIFRCL